MSSRPTISVVIDNYNYARFLPDAIDSALTQNYPCREVIVVDDGSTDNSHEVIAGYGSRVIPIFKENRGQASAFNAGVAASHGDIIMFLDADDMLHPTAAEKIASIWRPGVSKIQYWLDTIDEDGNIVGRLWQPKALSTDELRDSLMQGLIIEFFTPASGSAYTRSALSEVVPIPEGDWKLCADAFLSLMSPFTGEVLTITQPLGAYRVHGKNGWTAFDASPERLQRDLLIATQYRVALEAFGRPRGFSLPPDWQFMDFRYVSARILSSRSVLPGLASQDRSRWQLLGKALRAALRRPYLTPRQRAAYAMFFIALGLVPRKLCQPLAAARLNYMKRMVGTSTATHRSRRNG